MLARARGRRAKEPGESKCFYLSWPLECMRGQKAGNKGVLQPSSTRYTTLRMSTRRRKGGQHMLHELGEATPSGEASGPATPLLEDHHEQAEHEHEPPNIAPAVGLDETTGQQRPLLHRIASSFVIPLTDQTGSPSNIIKGLLSLAILGGLLGIAMPKDENLPTPWYRLVSSIIGYTYFCAWSISFYPQVILNLKRQSTSGLSNEFSVLNVAGFACYATYTLCLFFSPEIRRQYKERNGADAEITVQSNDVAFAVHALILCCIQLSQIVYYRGFDASPLSIYVKIGLATLLVVCVVFATLVAEHFSSWLDFLYMLSFVKIIISLVKYTPQVFLNYSRQSTQGWNIWNIVLDFVGGTLSIGQQIGDSADLHDFSGITGNPAKFALGFVSILFDLIFFFQHYLLYPAGEENGESGTGRTARTGTGTAGEGTPAEPLLNNDNREKRDEEIRESISEETPIVEEV